MHNANMHTSPNMTLLALWFLFIYCLIVLQDKDHWVVSYIYITEEKAEKEYAEKTQNSGNGV